MSEEIKKLTRDRGPSSHDHVFCLLVARDDDLCLSRFSVTSCIVVAAVPILSSISSGTALSPVVALLAFQISVLINRLAQPSRFTLAITGRCTYKAQHPASLDCIPPSLSTAAGSAFYDPFVTAFTSGHTLHTASVMRISSLLLPLTVTAMLPELTLGLVISRREGPCNGSDKLCNRPYGLVTFLGAHDSFAISSSDLDSKSYLYLLACSSFNHTCLVATDQHVGITEQLNKGVRMLQGQMHKDGNELKLCHTSCVRLFIRHFWFLPSCIFSSF